MTGLFSVSGIRRPARRRRPRLVTLLLRPRTILVGGGAIYLVIAEGIATLTSPVAQADTTTSITIVKDAVPNDAQDFTFESTNGLGSFTLDDDAAAVGGDATFPERMTFFRDPGTYQVRELLTTGDLTAKWQLDGIVCDDPSGDTTTNVATRSASIDLDVGEQITCTFTNRLTSITIVKDAVPSDATDFTFDIVTGGGTGSMPPFTLDDDPADAAVPDRRTFYFEPGAYQFVEQFPSSFGWLLDTIVCDDPSGGTTTSVATRSANIDLDVGEQITCTYTNRLTSITIVKDTAPNEAADFTFDTVPSLSAAFTLDDDAGAAGADDTFQDRTTFFVNPGTFRFIERDPASSGWRVDSITCDDPSNGTTTSVATRTATIDLDVGERITCTFTNRLNPARVTLSPTEATNMVGTSHTVTATVTDAFGGPVANTTVRFTVSGSVNTTGSCTTGPAGTCTFTYPGPAFPGADSIAGCADANNSGTPDIGEPCSEKVAKAWILPASTPGQVTGGGHVIDAAENQKVAFGFNAQSSSNGFKGNCTVVDIATSRSVKIKCLDVTTLIQTSTSATIYGHAEINGTATGYRIDVTDLAEPGRDRDAFAIQTTSGYSAGGTLDGGNIQIHRAD
jgi:hypothetical protein